MESPNRKYKIIIISSIVLINLIVFGLIWLINRNKPFLTTVLYYVIALIILGIFAGIVYLIVWLFKKQRIDLLYVMKNQILDSCEINKPAMKTPILLYDNNNSRTIGEFFGYSMIKTADWGQFINSKNPKEQQFFNNFINKGSNIENKELKKDEFLYIISFKTVSGKKELLLALESDFNSLDANPLIFYGRGLAPKLYEFHFLAKHYDMAEKIELPVKTLIDKYTIEHNLREMVNIIDNAIDVDAQFRKAQEKSNIDDFRPGDKPQNG